MMKEPIMVLACGCALAVSAARIQGYRVAFRQRANADGTVTIVATIAEDGLAIIFR